MCRSRPDWPHLVKPDLYSALCNLPCRFAAGEPAADNGDDRGRKRNIFQWNTSPAATALGKSERSPLLARRGGAKRRGGGSIVGQIGLFIRTLTHHPVCGFAAAAPPGQEGRSFRFSRPAEGLGLKIFIEPSEAFPPYASAQSTPSHQTYPVKPSVQ